jgi:hypothetical protein
LLTDPDQLVELELERPHVAFLGVLDHEDHQAHADLGQVQLEPADILGRRGVGRAIEKRSKPLAAVNVAPLRARTELPRVHVLDHAMTQRGDGVRTH